MGGAGRVMAKMLMATLLCGLVGLVLGSDMEPTNAAFNALYPKQEQWVPRLDQLMTENTARKLLSGPFASSSSISSSNNFPTTFSHHTEPMSFLETTAAVSAGTSSRLYPMAPMQPLSTHPASPVAMRPNSEMMLPMIMLIMMMGGGGQMMMPLLLMMMMMGAV